ncbi:hypothetical protein B0H19DRAFT_386776 [Mycena capillaripes]|nr:hypothetical protein B0H19DRAFT_386776 [Mycena capillaripes]
MTFPLALNPEMEFSAFKTQAATRLCHFNFFSSTPSLQLPVYYVATTTPARMPVLQLSHILQTFSSRS